MSEELAYDCVIVGAGPAGLAAAIRLKQLEPNTSVAVLEKGSVVGAHILSGAVFEPRALDELLPDWRKMDSPIKTAVTTDKFFFLTKKGKWRLPTPPQMHNHKNPNYIISLGNLCQWLATHAESLGVEIYPGFAVYDPLFDEQGNVKGVRIGNKGIAKDGSKTPNYEEGVSILAKQTLVAEGAHGSLAKKLIRRFGLRNGKSPQTYGLGIKEVWQIDPAKHQEGTVIHSVGWPLDYKTYGGSFIYHTQDNTLSIGFVVGLDYQNPYLSPFEEMQRFKTHPYIKELLKGGKRISYGARALNEGGFQSIPKLTFPGGMLIGCAAGFLNVPKIKGSHTAMKSGMVAAEAFIQNKEKLEQTDYEQNLKQSWVWSELKKERNIRPAFRWGLWIGILYSALETYIFRGRSPWTLKMPHPDNKVLKPARKVKKIDYPKPDGVLTFDRLSSVYLSGVAHEENQPTHLVLKDQKIPINYNLDIFDAPEQRYCPAGVYEIVKNAESQPYLQINSQNCVHCKTCDIKDPTQNITWVPPEGGGGPNYSGM